MSILIKGAKMPKNCCECAGAYCDNNRWLCTLAGEYVDRFIYVECGRPTFCPLVEIPPHGRLIDANETKRVFGDYFEKVKVSRRYAESLVENAIPTVIESEEQDHEV